MFVSYSGRCLRGAKTRACPLVLFIVTPEALVFLNRDPRQEHVAGNKEFNFSEGNTCLQGY